MSAYSGTPIDVPTFHYDNSRSGWNPTETDLTPATVASVGGRFVAIQRLTVAGSVYAQPLLVAGFVMPDGSTHDVLLVTTELNDVYAFDAKTYVLLWQVNLGPPQNSTDVGCSDVRPSYGVTGTPVIVRTGPGTATVYVVAATEPYSFQFHHFLHALNLASGADLVAPTEISPSATLSDGTIMSFDPQNQFTRPGLAYNNGSIYVSVGAHCDKNPNNVTGWVLQYDPTLTLQNAYHDIGARNPGSKPSKPGENLASIWMSGFAPAIDASGNLFVVSGNGYYNPSVSSFGQSVIKLTPNLSQTPLGAFTPPNYAVMNSLDLDFASGGVILVPTAVGSSLAPQAVAMGKDPIIYLLDQGLGMSAMTSSYRLNVPAQNGTWGGPAYFNGPAGQEVYYQTNDDYLRAYQISSNAPNLTALPVTGTTLAGYGGSSPVVSSNGSTAGTGIVWVVRRSAPEQLEAYDASALGAPIYTAVLGSHKGFDTPLVANGRVFVGGSNIVTVFGLHP